LDEALNELSKDPKNEVLAEKIFTCFEEYANKNYTLPSLVVYYPSIPISKINTKTFKGMLTGILEEPKTGKRYENFEEIHKDFGKNFEVVNAEQMYKREYYKYLPDYDRVLGITFDVEREPKRLNGILKIKDRAIIRIHIGDVETESKTVITKQGTHYNVKCNDDFWNDWGRYGLDKACFKKYGRLVKFSFDWDRYEVLSEVSRNVENKAFAPASKSAQNVLNDLLKIDLPKLTKSQLKEAKKNYCPAKTGYFGKKEHYYTVLEVSHVKDNVSALRWIAVDKTFKVQDEYIRIYFVKDKMYACCKDNLGNFVSCNTKFLIKNIPYADYVFKVKDDVSGTKLSDIEDIINNMSTYDSKLFLEIVKDTTIEQLCRIGCMEAVSYTYDNSHCYNDASIFEKFFKTSGPFNFGEKDILKFLGLNSDQLQSLTELKGERYNVFNVLTILKKKHKIKDFSSMDINSFREIVAKKYEK